MKKERIILNEKRNVKMTAYLQPGWDGFPKIEKRPAVLIIPGGGYQVCSPTEADPVAFGYLKAGYQVFILRYSVGEFNEWPNPLDDYEQAMEMIRAKADEWRVYPDKIAVIGFSAGGHLACAAAAMSKNRPNAAILGYPAAGEDVQGYNPSAPDAIAAIDENTCPCFIFATRNDHLVPIKNSLKIMEALNKAGVSFESHIYNFGPHGFSIAHPSIGSISHKKEPISARAKNWVSDSISWLSEMFGEICDGGMTEPVCARYADDNHAESLSADCTIEHIMHNPEGAAVLAELMKRIDELNCSYICPDLWSDEGKYFKDMTLRAFMQEGAVPTDEAEAVELKLHNIKNDR